MVTKVANAAYTGVGGVNRSVFSRHVQVKSAMDPYSCRALCCGGGLESYRLTTDVHDRLLARISTNRGSAECPTASSRSRL